MLDVEMEIVGRTRAEVSGLVAGEGSRRIINVRSGVRDQ